MSLYKACKLVSFTCSFHLAMSKFLSHTVLLCISLCCFISFSLCCLLLYLYFTFLLCNTFCFLFSFSFHHHSSFFLLMSLSCILDIWQCQTFFCILSCSVSHSVSLSTSLMLLSNISFLCCLSIYHIWSLYLILPKLIYPFSLYYFLAM